MLAFIENETINQVKNGEVDTLEKYTLYEFFSECNKFADDLEIISELNDMHDIRCRAEWEEWSFAHIFEECIRYGKDGQKLIELICLSLDYERYYTIYHGRVYVMDYHFKDDIRLQFIFEMMVNQNEHNWIIENYSWWANDREQNYYNYGEGGEFTSAEDDFIRYMTEVYGECGSGISIIHKYQWGYVTDLIDMVNGNRKNLFENEEKRKRKCERHILK